MLITKLHPESRVQTRSVSQRWNRMLSLSALALSSTFFGSRIVHNQLDALVTRKMANDFRVDPWDRFKFSRPIIEIMRPCKPGGSVRLPLGRETTTRQTGS